MKVNAFSELRFECHIISNVMCCFSPSVQEGPTREVSRRGRGRLAPPFLVFLLMLLASHCGWAQANAAARADVEYQKGLTLLKRGDLAEARRAFEQTVKLVPSSAEAHNSLGWVLLSQNDTAGAITELQTAVRLKPRFLEARINLAIAFIRIRKLEDAQTQASEAVRLDESNAEGHRTLGRILSLQNDAQGAIKELNRAVEVAPQRG